MRRGFRNDSLNPGVTRCSSATSRMQIGLIDYEGKLFLSEYQGE